MYWPGIAGNFLFDDYPNLQLMETIGAQPDTWRGVLTYLDSSFAGPTKRPVAMLSFLLEYGNWPGFPAEFKRNNILFHLATTLAVAWFALLVIRRVGQPEHIAMAVAVLTAALFALHPIQVSTVLYVVQRMAILAAFFCLLALIAFLKGVALIERGRCCGWLLLLVCYPLLGALSLLSKENGVLVVLLAAVIVYFLPIDGNNLRRSARAQLNVVAFAPAALLLLLLAAMFVRLMLTNPTLVGREFTVMERLYTQPRILLDYLSLLAFPRMQSAGVYNDGVAISTSLFNPVTTLPAMVVITLAILGAFRLRRRYPLLGLGIVGFFAAHLIESSFIGLELYFEHRNYLPSVFLFIAAAALLVDLAQRRREGGALAIGLILAVYGTFLFMNVDLWRDNRKMFMVWAEQTPSSERAQLQVASLWARNGEYAKALSFVERGAAAKPDSPRSSLYDMAIKCHAGLPITDEMIRNTLHALRVYPYHQSTYNYFKEVLIAKRVANCSLSFDSLAQLTDALFSSETIRSGNVRALKHFELGNLLLAQGDAAGAAAEYAKANALRSDLQAGLIEVASLATKGYFALALEHLDRLDARGREVCSRVDSPTQQARCEWVAAEAARLRSVIRQEQLQMDKKG